MMARSCLVAALLLCISVVCSQGSPDCGDNCQQQQNRAATKVPVELYYEALCPYSRNFIRDQLLPTWQKVGDIMNITMIPYGNAHATHTGDHWTFRCQHGSRECLGNQIHTCAIGITKDINIYLPFIECMMKRGSDVKSAATYCAQHQSNVPIDQIMNCTTSAQGNNWEHDMAVLSDATDPHKSYVPWVVFWNQHTERIQNAADADLTRLVCDNYKGTKPAACSSHSSPTVG